MAIFKQAQDISQSEKDAAILSQKLDQAENEFRSVAYEAASMTIALHDFENGDELHGWKEFKNIAGKKHAAQVHAGLGWAIAQKKISPFTILESLDPIMQFRVADGCGYYDGMFRQRAALSGREIAPGFSGKFIHGYDQGIGRALYYHCKGAAEKLPAMAGVFPDSRRADLWRGIGIACVYVGGCDEKMLGNIYSLSSPYGSQLAISAALVARARHDAGAATSFAGTACICWCGCPQDEAVAVTVKMEAEAGGNGNAYSNWMHAIAGEFAQASFHRA
jgi:hypothetical protein